MSEKLRLCFHAQNSNILKNSSFQASYNILVMKRRERSVKLVLDEKQSQLILRKLKW